MDMQVKAKNGRIKTHALPKCNNAHINNTTRSQLLVNANGGNHDVKYIYSPHNVGYYAASSSAKPEAADFKMLAA
jgi:hypothetical protein